MSVAWTIPLDSAWSEDARSLARRADKEGTASAAATTDRLEELEQVWVEAQQPGWNGYRGRPVERDTLFWAASFLHSLPKTWEAPEISADPDGDITFEWSAGPSRVFAVSIDRNGAAHYAGLFGRSRRHGVEENLDLLPQIISESLARLFPPLLSHAS